MSTKSIVSILTSSEELVEPASEKKYRAPNDVSILTSSEELVEPGRNFVGGDSIKFQSSPAPKSWWNETPGTGG